MFYTEVIKKGITFLKSTQNIDGGIPIGKVGDESGFWTTAEVLEAMLSTDYFQFSIENMRFVTFMVRYLQLGFLDNNLGGGYWEGKRGSGASTMTTGHVIYALTLFLNKSLDLHKEIKIVEDNVVISVLNLKKEIENIIDKATTWILEIQNQNGGWGPSENSESNIVCCYYVLKGLSAVGKNAETDTKVYLACLLIKKQIQEIINKRKGKLNGNDFAEILYGYMGLKLVKYFKKYDIDFEKSIDKFIKKNWKRLQQNVATEELASASQSFLNNLPWITLNTLLWAENYEYSKKINWLLKLYTEQQGYNGAWVVKKNNEDQTTWITAEIINDFNLAQTRYLKYQNEIIFVRKFKLVKLANVLLGLLCAFSILTYTWGYINDSVVWYEQIWNFVITLLGVISSVITIANIKIEP